VVTPKTSIPFLVQVGTATSNPSVSVQDKVRLTRKIKGTIMNQDQVQGKFEQLRGKIKETWGKLSDNDIALANGQKEQFFGKLQEIYGLNKEDAEKSYSEIEKMYR
jgi:uncharacterized protein YjbJ (UPF0337 family)